MPARSLANAKNMGDIRILLIDNKLSDSLKQNQASVFDGSAAFVSPYFCGAQQNVTENCSHGKTSNNPVKPISR